MNATVVIPARMASTRIPGKPLADICGKPMIWWVYERASRAKSVSQVLVATCDREILDAVEAFGGRAVMTSDQHRSGTDRIAEAAANLEADIIVNVQGDEPLIDPASIDRAVEPFAECGAGHAPRPGPSPSSLAREGGGEGGVQMTSLMVPIDSESARDPNLVKVVVDSSGFALYFSRSPIPYERSSNKWTSIYGHLGIYAYTREFLLEFAAMDPTPLELTESLEQLRVLEHGYRIRMVEVTDRPLGVDTPADLDRVRDVLNSERQIPDPRPGGSE